MFSCIVYTKAMYNSEPVVNAYDVRLHTTKRIHFAQETEGIKSLVIRDLNKIPPHRIISINEERATPNSPLIISVWYEA